MTENKWNCHRSINAANQGLVIDQNTGANIAVVYDGNNTAIIAAAPELLAALEYVVNWHRENDNGEGDLFGRDYITTAIAAILKAKGQ